MKVDKLDDLSFHLSQPHLIDSILWYLGLIDMNDDQNRSGGKPTPAMSTKLIGPDINGGEFDYPWEDWSMICKLNFLEKSTGPDISYSVHQCARFMAAPKQSHGETIKQIGRYLLDSRDKGIFLKPNGDEVLVCYVDADFLGNWDSHIAGHDPNTAKSQTGFVIKYARVPVYWVSKMQTQFSLSSAESEFLALSSTTQHAKALMYLLEEVNTKVVKVSTVAQVYFRVFEDKSAALEIFILPKICPCTRHINVVYHHFRGEVANKRLIILTINTKLQEADILTKPVEQKTLENYTTR